MPKRLPLLLLTTLLLSACAQRLPLVSAPTVTQPSEATLLQSLAHCGEASSHACAEIHLNLARHYLEAQPLTPSAIAAARSELAMAAQNPAMARETQPWRNLLTFQQQSSRPAAPRSCPNNPGNTAASAEIAQLKAQNALQKQQLDRLNSLLQAEARKSLQGKHP